MKNRVEIDISKPGCLVYLEKNNEYLFPAYEQDNEIVVVDFPTRRRVFLFFGWFVIPRKHPLNNIDEVRSQIRCHFRKIGKPMRFFDREKEAEQSFTFHLELFEHQAIASNVLEAGGFNQFTDYASIDVLHTEYGLEICGICDES